MSHMVNNNDVGRLMYEKNLLIIQGNEIAAERLQILIDQLLREKKYLDEKKMNQ